MYLKEGNVIFQSWALSHGGIFHGGRFLSNVIKKTSPDLQPITHVPNSVSWLSICRPEAGCQLTGSYWPELWLYKYHPVGIRKKNNHSKSPFTENMPLFKQNILKLSKHKFSIPQSTTHTHLIKGQLGASLQYKIQTERPVVDEAAVLFRNPLYCQCTLSLCSKMHM